jgi:uncharacterized SAM-binding protein YcdF (DUF218 family)
LTLGRHLAVMVAEAVVGGAILISTVPWPSIPHPSNADAVVLLSGDGARLPEALALMEEGVAPTLLFVGQPDTMEVEDLCHQVPARPFEVVCMRPNPDSTRAEARVTGDLAEARGWESIVLVTSRYHVSRASLLFRRCFDGTVHAVGRPPIYGWNFARKQIQHEALGLVHATLLARGC